MLLLNSQPPRSWEEITEEASHEKNTERLIELARELERALDERDRKDKNPQTSVTRSKGRAA